jgi:hypothetical protein
MGTNATISRGDIVLTPQGITCTVMGVSMAGRATIRDEAGVVIAIEVDQLQKVDPAYAVKQGT